jgi:multiple sugar transport system permease protein
VAKAIIAEATQTAEQFRSQRRAHWMRLFSQQVLPRIILIAVCALFLLPFYWMVVTALKTTPELAKYPPTFFPSALRWSNFRDATHVITFWLYMRNTAIITALTVIASVISNPIIAYGFSRIEWPGRDKVFLLVLATVFVPFPVLIVALFDIFAKLHWVNTYLPLIVPMFFGQAFWIFLMRQFLMGVPREISDAARIDGANEFRIFYEIVLPQALPAIGVISIFAAIYAWHDFLGPLTYLQDASKYTIAVGLASSRSQHAFQHSLAMAAATIAVIPVIVLFLFFQRAFVEGITVGSIK